jgi:hypothetical protein
MDYGYGWGIVTAVLILIRLKVTSKKIGFFFAINFTFLDLKGARSNVFNDD